MAEITSIIKSINLTYSETTNMGSEGRSFIATELPKVKGEMFLDSTSLGFEGQMNAEEANELEVLLKRVAMRLTEEVKITLSQ